MIDSDHTGNEAPSIRPKVERRGGVSVEMTAADIVTLAVNVTQNEFPLDIPGCDSAAMRVVMNEVFEQIIEENRRAVSKRCGSSRDS